MYSITFRCVHATIVAMENQLSIKKPKSVLVALGIQRAMLTCHTVICGLSGSTIFFHILLSMA